MCVCLFVGPECSHARGMIVCSLFVSIFDASTIASSSILVLLSFISINVISIVYYYSCTITAAISIVYSQYDGRSAVETG